jgi:hypothetical protein
MSLRPIWATQQDPGSKKAKAKKREKKRREPLHWSRLVVSFVI